MQVKTYFSELLGESLKLNVTTGAMRTIDKKFGLDNYLLKTKPKHLGEGLVLELRERVLVAQRAKQEMEKRKAEETAATTV